MARLEQLMCCTEKMSTVLGQAVLGVLRCIDGHLAISAAQTEVWGIGVGCGGRPNPGTVD